MWGWGGITAELVESLWLAERLGIVAKGGGGGGRESGAGGICLLHISPPFPYLVLSRQRLLLYKHKIDSGGEVSGSLTVYKGRGVCVFVYMCVCCLSAWEREPFNLWSERGYASVRLLYPRHCRCPQSAQHHGFIRREGLVLGDATTRRERQAENERKARQRWCTDACACVCLSVSVWGCRRSAAP